MTPDAPTTEQKVTEEIRDVQKSVKDIPKKAVSSATTAVEQSASKVGRGLPINLNSKLLKIMAIVLAVFIVLLVIGKLYQTIKNSSKKQAESPTMTQEETVTPTTKFVISVTPKLGESVYANDPVIAEIEEELEILENEISKNPLRESLLIPPTLDFNISF